MDDPRRLAPMGAQEQSRLLDLFSFSREVCGYKDLVEIHLRWFQEFLRNQFLLLVSPRGHLKTSSLTAYILWRLIENRNLRILILSEVLSNAKDILSAIKAHIASERFRALYGNWDSLSATWTAEKIMIPRDKVLKEASITAAGILGTILSQHVDLLLIDDPQGEKNSASALQRKKGLSWLQKTVLPILEPNGQALLAMTRWHRDDLAGHIMSDPGFKNWKIIEQRAEWTDEQGRHILFPERFPPATLDRLRANMGSLAFRTQYLNDIGGQEDSAFRIEWIESARFDKAPEGLRTYCGIDLFEQSTFRVWTPRKMKAKALALRYGLRVRLMDGEAELFVPAALADTILPAFGAKTRRDLTPEQLEAAKLRLEQARNGPNLRKGPLKNEVPAISDRGIGL